MNNIVRYIPALFIITTCGPVGDSTSRSWKCMVKGGEEHCEPQRGERGEKGDTGDTGQRGAQGVPGQVGPAGPSGSRGERGEQGKEGAQGPAGSNGSSCTVTPTGNGAILSCTDGTTVVVLNGTDGRDGAPAPQSAYTIIELIDPCGKQGAFDEVLLKTGNGTLLAHYSHGNKEFLTVLAPGNYVTTDGTSCYFTVTNTGTITGEHN